MIPQSVIDDDNEHTMHYSQSLPYANLLDKEAEIWLSDICTHLVISVRAKDFTGGALAWVRRLSSYMDMKHAIPRETRVTLAKLLYDMVLMPGMDAALVELWSNNCIRLIRHKKRLGPEDLQLEWRPLYDMIQKSLFQKERHKSLASEHKLIEALIRLVGYVQRYFSPTAPSEMLSEFLPKFSTHSVPSAIEAQGYLVLFLPVEYHPQHTIHADTYLPTIFSLWSMLTYSASYDTQFAYIVSHIAENHLDQGNGEIGLFTKQQVKSVFTTGLRMMNLPVGSRSDGSNSVGGAAGGSTTGYGSQGHRVDSKAGNAAELRKKPEKFKSLARFIVYTIMPEADGSSYSLSLLSDMIQATELYFHPSNHGAWSYLLTAFARHLAQEFLKRWREEQEDDCTTPQHRRLTLDLRREFVLILRPVTYLSMFGKDQYTVGASQSTLKYLSWLEPGLIFPGLLERIYPSLETLTETHRTSSALSILADVALPLFSRDNYPAGGKHLLPLLHLSIPGIDLNDPIKTIASLMFISTSLMSIPICDMSQLNDGYYPTEEAIDDPNATLSRATEDYLVKATTGDFEEWLAKFMRRVFTIFENLPQESRKKQGSSSSSYTMESGLTHLLLHACDIIFGQLSDELYDLALRLIVDFVTDRVLPNAVRGVGLLCDAITTTNPKKAARVFLPLCISNIQMELEHGASATATHAASSNLIQSDSTFHWYQNILFSVVSNLGPEILPYKQELVAITQSMVQQCRSRRGMMWTGKLMRSVLNTTLNVYPKDFRSLNPSQWTDKEFMSKNAHQVWGQPGDPANLEIRWHTPSEAEKDFALEFLMTFLMPSLTRLYEIMSSESAQQGSHDLTNELCRHLAVVRNCLMGSATMVADDGVAAAGGEDKVMQDASKEEDKDEETEPMIVKRFEVGYAFTDPTDPRTDKARSIRYTIGELIHKLSDFFKNKREDDVESVKILIKIARNFLSERGVEKAQFDRSKNGYSYAKNVGKTPLCKKRYPRNLLVRRAYNHHLLRLRLNVQARIRTPLHDAILTDLLEMSLGSYAEIRKVSQVALSATARCFRDSKHLILPTLLDALGPQAPADSMKGALYLFTHKSILMPCLRNWQYIPRFVLALCSAQHQDKLSIQEIIRKVFVEYITHVGEFSFRVLVTDDQLESLTAPLLPQSTLTAADVLDKTIKLENQVVSRNKDREQAYDDMVESLLNLLEDSRVHWRYATMAANLVETFLRPDRKLTKRLAAFANNASLSELPAMRRIGFKSTTRLLLYIKERTLAAGNQDLLLVRSKARNPLKIQVQVPTGNHTLSQELLKASYQPLAADSILVDDKALGWYVWPSTYQAYKVNTNDFLFANNVDIDSQPAFDEFQATFCSDDYWTKLCAYLSQESNQKHEDMFKLSHAHLFRSIFQTFGDRPLAVAKPHIEKLCEATDQKNAQRAASEILCGLIRGTKHWSLAKLDEVWQWLTPILRKTFNSITPDSLTYWESLVRHAVARRDPRRVQPLIDLVLESELDPTSDAAFSESRKLLLVRAVVVRLGWQFEPLVNRLLPTYLQNVQHSYKQVREVIGVNINELLQLEWIPSFESVDRLLKANDQTDGVGNVPTTLNSVQEERVNFLIQHLDAWFIEMNASSATNGSSDYAHASKTILCWLHEALGHHSVAGTLPYLVPLLPKLFTMQEINDDQDLQQMATRVLNLFARANYPPSMLPTLIDSFLNILTTSTSWHIRIRALPVLQIFFFKHLFAMTSTQLLRIMEVIGHMLLDSQIEVRQLAAVTLGGLVRCSQRDAIQSLLAQFTTQIRVRIPKRKRDANGKSVEPVGFAEAVLQKHAGVLGISCLINAFPYEVPEWMPTVLCQLADCMSDPAAEIQATIRKTFSDFRRTHSDTWHEDMLKFDEDQLSILSDMLISPSYYA